MWLEREAAEHRQDEVDDETGADRDADLQPMAVHPRDAHVPIALQVFDRIGRCGPCRRGFRGGGGPGGKRSEEHKSELQSLMRISYAGICLKKKRSQQNI